MREKVDAAAAARERGEGNFTHTRIPLIIGISMPVISAGCQGLSHLRGKVSRALAHSLGRENNKKDIERESIEREKKEKMKRERKEERE